jgi:hypothetical protein
VSLVPKAGEIRNSDVHVMRWGPQPTKQLPVKSKRSYNKQSIFNISHIMSEEVQ